MWFLRFKQTVCFLLLPWFASVMIQSFGRIFLLFIFAHEQIANIEKQDIINLFVIGLKYDIRIACISFGTLLLFSLFISLSQKVFAFWLKYLLIFSTLLVLIISIFTLVNIGYFKTYDRHIDVFIFGLIDDDTTAILQTIWQDYPVVVGFILLVIIYFIYYRFNKYWLSCILRKINKRMSIWFEIPTLFIVLLLIFIGCRGSLGTFPLRKSDAQVSSNNIINMFVPNGLMALSWAYSDYKIESDFTPIPLSESKQALLNFFSNEKNDSVDIFFEKTLNNDIAQQKHPNVVLAIMESMGTHLFEFDNENRDLLGELRAHLQKDFVFWNFISEGDGTIDSLNRFLIRSPISKISQSSAQFNTFKSNMFQPFLDNGYKVIFITAGNGAWRNLNQFLPHLGVTEFVDQTTLKNMYPEAKIDTWGIPDEFMFKYALQRLEKAEKDNEHVMIMMLSITNHPPYKIPDSAIYQDYALSDEEKNRLKNFGPEKETITMFNTFRYSNDQLGQFITNVKQSDYSSHTIISFTGDHNLRGIGYPEPADNVLSHAVPFYIYVPSEYRKTSLYDKNRVGSHKDIFPTLYQLSLSQTKYYQTGCNLLQKDLDMTWCNIGYNPNIYINSEGAYIVQSKEFRPWIDLSTFDLKLDKPTTLTNQQSREVTRWNSFTDLLYWQIIEQINHPD
ncbi:sulfatase-like hydrolase/transferase [Orbus wheelerorum]|uniref:LTA synthase family protein n=1 Tax=Orbus wheelerorum TaxID=3074111 RepID=UPI00370DC4BF